jgi:hypothetical protein
MRRQRRNPRPWAVVAVAAVAAVAACNSSAPTLNPSSPPPGLDTSQSQMVDGAGNAGPVRVTLQTVSPPLNSQVKYDTGDCTNAAPFTCFLFQAQFCMDAVPNPTNATILKTMMIGGGLSADGVTAIRPVTLGMDKVASGACATVATPAGNAPPFTQPSEGAPRFFILIAEWGTGAVFLGNVNKNACTTSDAIASGNPVGPPCAYRRVYELDYHF